MRLSKGTAVEQVPEHRMLSGVPAVIHSEPMRKLMAMVLRVALHATPVLILGETGCGKEIVARAIHQYSLRCSRPLVDVNCGALPDHLVESELFGYEKGAFSGADDQKQGLFELADKGILFLDEIGDLDLKLQVKLLRVLDGIPYYRLGGTRKVSVDVRVIAATNRDLDAAVSSGRFRSDLYHRLSQFQLFVPPLRERPEDILPIAQHFLKDQHMAAKFSADAVQALMSYSWPGNVRELRNVVLKTAILSEDPGQEIHAADLPPEITRPPARTEQLAGDLAALERKTILDALARAGGHQGKAAEQLGISRRTLIRKVKSYALDAAAGNAAAFHGLLSSEQQQYFRAEAELPVQVVFQDGQYVTAVTANISAKGLALQAQAPLKPSAAVRLRFILPEEKIQIEGEYQMVWADSRGKAGFQLTQMVPSTQQELDQWLLARIAVEGWFAVA